MNCKWCLWSTPFWEGFCNLSFVQNYSYFYSGTLWTEMKLSENLNSSKLSVQTTCTTYLAIILGNEMCRRKGGQDILIRLLPALISMAPQNVLNRTDYRLTYVQKLQKNQGAICSTEWPYRVSKTSVRIRHHQHRSYIRIYMLWHVCWKPEEQN
jgi:hypothetical protein